MYLLLPTFSFLSISLHQQNDRRSLWVWIDWRGLATLLGGFAFAYPKRKDDMFSMRRYLNGTGNGNIIQCGGARETDNAGSCYVMWTEKEQGQMFVR